MKLVVTDDFFVDLGAYHGSRLNNSGKCCATPIRWMPTMQSRLLGDAEAVFINRCQITEKVMTQCPNLKYIGTFGTGVDSVDLAAAKKHGVTVCNVPSYGKNAVAQMALAFEIVRNVSLFDQQMKAKGWNSPSDDWLRAIPQMELGGKILGIIGVGDIGYAVARVAMAMDMQVLA